MASIERRSSVCNMKNTSWAFHWQHIAPPHVPREFTRAQFLCSRYVCLSVTVWWVGCRRCLVSHDHSQLTIASPADPLVGDLHRFQSRTWKQEKQFSPLPWRNTGRTSAWQIMRLSRNAGVCWSHCRVCSIAWRLLLLELSWGLLRSPETLVTSR